MSPADLGVVMLSGAWITFPLGGDMEQINCYAFFDLAIQITGSFNNARTKLNLWNQLPERASAILDSLLNGDLKVVLEVSAPSARALRDIMIEISHKHKADGNAELNDAEVQRFNAAVFSFFSALQLELGRAPTFFVTPKGVYDTQRLINNADAMYAGFVDRLPAEALADTREAGRCLAFSLHTAAGFHIARATESVIKKYMEVCGCTPLKESQRNWGAYTKALIAVNANKIIIHHIDQLRELHRNPITHPEVTLTQAEALALQAMCLSLIQAMVGDMESKRKNPEPSIAVMSPDHWGDAVQINAAQAALRGGWINSPDDAVPSATTPPSS